MTTYWTKAEAPPTIVIRAEHDRGTKAATDKTLGLTTSVKQKILGSSDWLISYTFYGQVVTTKQTISNNQLKLTPSRI